MTFDPLVTIQFHSSLGAVFVKMLHKKLENVFARARPFLSHRRVCCGAQIRVEMDGCKQMKVIVAHRMILSMHPCCQQEPEPTDFHESNENQAKEPFGSSGRSRARPNKTSSQKKFVLVCLKTSGWDRCLQKIISMLVITS
jgi:hypothetical protein